MPQPDPIQGFTGLPLWSEPYKVPETLKALYDFLVVRGIPRYATRAAADAAMPGAVAGQIIWSDADATLYARRAGEWQRLWPIVDTGWVAVEIASGFAAQGGGLAPMVRRIGSAIYHRGGWTNASMSAASTHVVGQLPTGFYPPVSQYGLLVSHNVTASGGRIAFLSTGVIQISTPATLGNYQLAYANWLAD